MPPKFGDLVFARCFATGAYAGEGLVVRFPESMTKEWFAVSHSCVVPVIDHQATANKDDWVNGFCRAMFVSEEDGVAEVEIRPGISVHLPMENLHYLEPARVATH